MIKVGVLEGGGYTAGELVRLLINHPDVEIVFVYSTIAKHVGSPITDVYDGLYGDTDLRFVNKLQLEEIDLLFLCTEPGGSEKFLSLHTMPKDLKIIDLSQDFCLGTPENGFAYGLPELNRRMTCASSRVATPGSLATAILLGLLPLAKHLMLNSELHIHTIAGATESSERMSPTSSYSWRSANASVYEPFAHPHLDEIKQGLTLLQHSFDSTINYIPVMGGFSRGIFTSTYLDCKVGLDEVVRLYEDYYDDHSFTFVTTVNPDLKEVINTNKCLIYLEKHGDKLLIISVIDNLLKGSSGQAIHNMNLLFNLEETVGLHLKASAF